MDIRDFFDYKVYKRELDRYVGNRKKIILPKWIDVVGVNAFYKSKVISVNINKVKKLSNHAFHNANNLQEVILNENITKIPSYCFASSTYLNRVLLPNTIERIEALAFARCRHLNELTIPNSVKALERGAFSESGLINVVIPSSVVEMEKNIFEECRSLETVIFNNSLETLPDSIFAYCDSLVSVILPSDLKVIDEYAFYMCNDLKEMKLPETVTTIKDHAFEVTGFKKLDLSNITHIGISVFADCEQLRTVKLNDSLEKLYEDTFTRSGLTTITLPSKLKVIGQDCFSHTKLRKIVLPFNLDLVANNAFADCKELETLIITNPRTIINKGAFTDCDNLKTIQYRKETIDVTNLILDKIDNKTLEYIYVNREKIEALKAPISINTIHSLDKLGLLDDFYTNAYFKNYRAIRDLYIENNEDVTLVDEETLFNLCYTMGVFDKELSQKSSELIKAQIINKNINDTNLIHAMSDVSLKKIDKNMINEITHNKGQFFIDALKELEKEPRFLGLCLMHYNEIQRYNSANSASHKQLKPTVKKFVDYLNIHKFKDVKSKDDAALAKEIGKFYSEQHVYDTAKSIMDKHKKKKVVKSLISEARRKEHFDPIDQVKEEIWNNVNKLDEKLTKVYYEFLRKDDGKNLTAGRYCTDCCAHIEGAGEDIAFASVLDSKTQTLVIKDAHDVIISKAVFNINSDDEIIVNGIYVNEMACNGREKEIADKYIEAFKLFMKDYKENKRVHIKGVYVGDRSPMLDYFGTYGKRIYNINVIDYSEYKIERPYSGDCDDGIVCIIDNRENTRKI